MCPLPVSVGLQGAQPGLLGREPLPAALHGGRGRGCLSSGFLTHETEMQGGRGSTCWEEPEGGVASVTHCALGGAHCLGPCSDLVLPDAPWQGWHRTLSPRKQEEHRGAGAQRHLSLGAEGSIRQTLHLRLGFSSCFPAVMEE